MEKPPCNHGCSKYIDKLAQINIDLEKRAIFAENTRDSILSSLPPDVREDLVRDSAETAYAMQKDSSLSYVQEYLDKWI